MCSTTFDKMGADVFANACGPCIGQWARSGAENFKEKNSIVHSFNRNFSEARDGNGANTHAFVGSPEVVTAIALAGDLTFNPMTDTLPGAEDGREIMLNEPRARAAARRASTWRTPVTWPRPRTAAAHIEVKDDPTSSGCSCLTPFEPWDGENLTGMRLGVKAAGKCTTDHISMAGPLAPLPRSPSTTSPTTP